MIEVWKDVEDYEELYQVSSLGNIRSLDRITKQKHPCGKILNFAYKGRAIKCRINKQGYFYFHASKNNNRKTLKVHRVVAKTFINNVENKCCVNHMDSNKLNNQVSNLEWVTTKENIRHAWDTKLAISKFGKNSNAVKTKLQVFNNSILIVELFGEKELSDFGLTSTGVWATLNNKQKTHRGYTFKREIL